MLENTKNFRYSARDRRLKIAQLDMKKSRFSSYSMVAAQCQEIWIGARVYIRSYTRIFDAKCLNSDTFDCDIMKRSWRVSKCQGWIQDPGRFGNGQK